MKSQGIDRVVSLLTASELETYAEAVGPALKAAFNEVLVADPKQPGAPEQIIEAIKAGHAKGEKVLIHCWGGGGRTGLVQAAALVATGAAASPQEAAELVLAQSSALSLSRRVDVGGVECFLKEATT